jgi:ATP-binding cassette subfamily B multidrug efflux pump
VTLLSYYSIYIVLTFFGAYQIIYGDLKVGELQAFVYYIYSASQPLSQLTQLSAVLQSATASSRRLFRILDEPEEKNLPFENKEVFTGRGELDFDDVDFSYVKDKPLMKDLNLHIPAGATVAIVGPTGAGKTTMINLLMRFYDVSKGKIVIDGVDTSTVSRDAVRKEFGMVLQDAWLYEGTIRENIRFGRIEATDEEVYEAARIANVDHYIETLPDGFDTVIDAEASNLSLGQKQLITIARAVISQPKILILDEATSSIDTRMERLIQEAMDKIMVGRTSFVIAHRLSTIRHADLILVMNHGNIVEQGTHDELLKLENGVYASLYNSQFSDFDEME